MTLRSMRRASAPVAVLTIVTFLAGMLPSRPARADDPANPPIATGTGGETTLGTPEGGGAATSLANVDAQNGAATASLVFRLPTARGSAQPSLSLTYSSRAAVGFAGVGWTLAGLPSIERRGASGLPQFADDLSALTAPMGDTFVFDGRPLVPVCLVGDGGSCPQALSGETIPSTFSGWIYFRSEIDDDNRYFFSHDKNSWVVQTKSGMRLELGAPLDGLTTPAIERSISFPLTLQTKSGTTISETPVGNSSTYRWNLARQYDAAGNAVVYVWEAKDDPGGYFARGGVQYLTDIYDTQAFDTPLDRLANYAHHTHLRWSDRDTAIPVTSSDAVWRSPPRRRLLGVDVSSQPMVPGAHRQLVRRYYLDYAWNHSGTRAYLQSFQMEGRCDAPVEEGDDGLLPTSIQCNRTPATTLTYTAENLVPTTATDPPKVGYITTAGNTSAFALVDLFGNGSPVFVADSEAFPPNGGPPTSGIISMATVGNLGIDPATAMGAKSGDLAPGSPHAIWGNWRGDGRINVLWQNVPQSPSGGQWGDAPYGIYSVVKTPSPTPGFPPSYALVGVGPKTTPHLRYVGQPLFVDSGKAFDVDGDALPDVGLIDDGGTGISIRAMRAFFAARQRNGEVVPFAQMGAPFCLPAWGSSYDATDLTRLRTVADVDGDGIADIARFDIYNDSGASTFGSNFRVHVFKGHGDGYFGNGFTDDENCTPGHGGTESYMLSTPPDHLFDNDDSAFLQNSRSRFILHDLTGDGLADLIVATVEGLRIYAQTRVVDATGIHHSFNGDRWLFHVNWNALGFSPPGVFDANRVALIFVDKDLSGTDELVIVDDTSNRSASVYDLTDGTKSGLLRTISNGIGAMTTISYDKLSHLAPGALAQPLWVVTHVETTNGLSGPHARNDATDFTYEAPVYDARDRSFIGFQAVTTTTVGDAAAPGLKVRTTYNTDTCPVSPTHPCAAAEDYWYRIRRGLPAVVEQFDASNGQHLVTTVYNYPIDVLYHGLDNRVVRRTSVGETDVYLWATQDKTNVTLPVMQNVDGGPQQTQTLPVDVPQHGKHLVRTQSYDTFGNENGRIDFGDPNVDKPIVTAITWTLPPSDPTGWNWRVHSRTVSYGAGANHRQIDPATAREVDFEYDARGLPTVVSAPLSGTLALSRDPAGAPAPANASQDAKRVVLSVAAYDAYTGNLTQVMKANGRCARFEYDRTYAQLQTSATVYRSGCGVDGLTTSTLYDRGLEVVTASYEASGQMTATSYDGFGRPTEVDQPDADLSLHTATNAAVKFDYSLAEQGPVRKLHVSVASGDPAHVHYDERWTYLDAFGRALLSVQQTEIANTWVVSGVRTLTAGGRVAHTYQPYFYVGDPSAVLVAQVPAQAWGTFTYDALGRPLTMANVDGVLKGRFIYDPSDLSQTRQDAEQLLAGGKHFGAYTKTIADGHGRVVRTIAHLADAKEDVTTDVGYLATGEPLSVTRTHTGNPSDSYTRSRLYDSLGRVVANLEPNTGSGYPSTPGTMSPTMQVWRYAYDDAGDLVGTSDARGCGENIFYDNLGRTVAEDYSPCPSADGTASQSGYSPADPKTGTGAEVFYVYDTAEDTSGASYNSLPYLGHLTAVYDRAQHSQVFLDARGRVTTVKKQIAVPGADTSGALATRYAPHWFQKDVRAYDEQNRVVTESTGVDTDAPTLRTSNGSFVTTAYTPRGTVASITSTYGDLLTSQTVNATGAVTQKVFGDAAHTTLDLKYWTHSANAGRLQEVWLHRGNGPWVTSGSTYVPPTTSDPNNTLEADLAHVTFDYDAVGNPTSVTDSANPGAWPDGAKPASKTMVYDDAYHLKEVDTAYAGGSDAFLSPYGGDFSFPPIASAPRPKSTTFAYDWMGDVTGSADDQGAFADRSFGTATFGGAGPNQLTGATAGGNSISATYDAAGNVTALRVVRGAPCKQRCTVSYDYEWDEVGRIARAVRSERSGSVGPLRQAVDRSYTYDASGALVTTQTYAPISSSFDAAFSINVFASLRLEHAKFVQGDYERTDLTETAYLGGVARAVVSDHDLPSASSGRLHVFFEIGDHLGSTSFVLDKDTGEVVERSSYLPYGAVDSDYRPDRWGNFRETQRYTGHEDEAEVGLVYFGHRFYIPMLMRWASPDPLSIHALGSDLNPYAFALGSPMRFTDATGLDSGDPNGGGGTPGCDTLTNPDCEGGGGGNGGGGFEGGGGGGGGRGGGGGGGGTHTPTGGNRPIDYPKPPPPPPKPQPGAIAKPFDPWQNASGFDKWLHTSDSWFASYLRDDRSLAQLQTNILVATAAVETLIVAPTAVAEIDAALLTAGASGAQWATILTSWSLEGQEILAGINMSASGLNVVGGAAAAGTALMAESLGTGMGSAAAQGAAETFANQLPGRLAGELDAAANAGATVVRAGGPGFDAVVNQGTVKFVVTESGELLVAPHTVNGVEISHAVLSGGQPVLTAGQAEIAGARGSYFGMSISNHSGHFMPSEASLSIARKLWSSVGVTFP